MPIHRLTSYAALASALLICAPLQAKTSAATDAPVIAKVTAQLMGPLSVFSPATLLAQSVTGAADNAAAPAYLPVAASDNAASDTSDSNPAADQSAANAATGKVADLRKALIAMAMKLRDIRYVRGGHDPSTGFDCSGFVRYVFAHAVGMQLPTNSASQFLAGLKVKRGDMKPGDLVFFHTRGHSRISHVGIYIADGQFIHSPASGKSVEISSLDEAYWAKHFAGAKRPEAMALAMVSHNG